MALNLWKIGGQPTSYNPLPVGTVNRVYVGLGDFAITFKAKSPSNAALKIGDVGEQDLNQTIALSNEFKTYSFTFKSTAYQQIYFYDNISKGDIIIDSIELVQKPLPKRTINGIDGFKSGKWTLHANATIIDDETLELNVTGAFQQSYVDLSLLPLTTYTVSVESSNPNGRMYVEERNASNVGIGILGYSNIGIFTRTFTTTNNIGGKLRIYLDGFNATTGNFTFKRPMLNLGSIPAPYEKKRGERMVMPVANGNGTFQLNPKPKKTISKAKTGLSFNGLTDYLQLPSMTMDSIEIDCLIDSGQSNPIIIDTRTGTATGYMRIDGTPQGAGMTSYCDEVLTTSPFPTNRRTKLKFVNQSTFTDDVTIFANYLASTKVKGTLYKVTCYLAGNIVAQYDFEKPSNIVGDKVIPNAKNLIPSFEDTRWSLHANSQVFGKDVLRLNATVAYQPSTLSVNVLPNTSYRFQGDSDSIKFYAIDKYDSLGVKIGTVFLQNGSKTLDFVTESNVIRLVINCTNRNTGSFDFIKPQLYQLDGKEGSLLGTPQKLNKANRASYYSKR